MQLVERTLAALTFLSKAQKGLSVSELSAKLDIPASSTHRILSSLKKQNFIAQDEETKRYRIGYKIFSLCSDITKNNSLIVSARPVMKKLSDEIGKSIVLCIKENNHIINIDCVEQEDSSMYMIKKGKEMPLYSTSAGRVFSAYMEREKVMEIYGQTELKAETPYTKTSLESLCNELDEIKKLGYALIDEELQLGIQGVACPIFDINGDVVASIAITSIKQTKPITTEMIEKLKETSKIISEKIS